jgi:DNA-binding CsgD family transcriptional regulator
VKSILTEREIEILKLVLNELSSESIAKHLNLSIRTIETHRKNIIRKTRCNTLIGLTKFGIQAGLLEGYFYRHNR